MKRHIIRNIAYLAVGNHPAFCRAVIPATYLRLQAVVGIMHGEHGGKVQACVALKHLTLSKQAGEGEPGKSSLQLPKTIACFKFYVEVRCCSAA